jgi:hypothetical protein
VDLSLRRLLHMMPAEISMTLGRALALWRGPALADVFSEVLQGEKSRLE